MAADTAPCPSCKDTGWIVRTSADGPRAERCECFEARKTALLLARANIPARYRDCTFQNFLIDKDPSQKHAHKLASKFAKDFPAVGAGLLFIGPCGVGKTHLAVAVLRELILKKGVPGLFYDFRDLIRDIQSTYTPDSDLNESDVLAPVFESHVLVLDELGAKRSTAWVEETIFYIINQRYNGNKITLFTSNYPDREEEEVAPIPWSKTATYKKDDDSLVERIGTRLRSRVYEMSRIVEMRGVDFRKIKQAGYHGKTV